MNKRKTGEDILAERKQRIHTGKSMTGEDILRGRGANISLTPPYIEQENRYQSALGSPANIKDDLEGMFGRRSDLSRSEPVDMLPTITPKIETRTTKFGSELPDIRRGIEEYGNMNNNTQTGPYGQWDNPTISAPKEKGLLGKIGDFFGGVKEKADVIAASFGNQITRPVERFGTKVLFNDWSKEFDNTPDEWKPHDILSKEEKENIQNYVISEIKPGDTMEVTQQKYNDLIKQTGQEKMYKKESEDIGRFAGFGSNYKPEEDVLFDAPLLGEVTTKGFGETAGQFGEMAALSFLPGGPFTGGFLTGVLDSYGRGGSAEEVLRKGIEMGTFNLVGGKVGKAVGGKVSQLIQNSPLKNTVLGEITTAISRGLSFGTAGTATGFVTSDTKPTKEDFFRNALMGAMFEVVPSSISSIKNIGKNRSAVSEGMKNYEAEMKADYYKAKTSKNPEEVAAIYDQMITRNAVVKQGLVENKFTGASKSVKQAEQSLDLISDILVKEKGSLGKAPEVNVPSRVQTANNIAALPQKGTEVINTQTNLLPAKTEIVTSQIQKPVDISQATTAAAAAKPENKISMDDRTYENVAARKVNAYQFEHPEVKDHIQTEANRIIGEIKNTVKGERFATTDENRETHITGIKKMTSPTIERIQKATKASYAEIENALTRIMQDEGAENTALAKKIELIIDDNLTSGVMTMQGEKLPADVDYLSKKGKIENKTYDEPKDLTANELPVPEGGTNGQPSQVGNTEKRSQKTEIVSQDKTESVRVAKNAIESAISRAKKEGIPEASAEIVEPKTHTQRQIKEVLKSLGYETHFYTSETLPATEMFDPKNPNTILVKDNNENDMLWAAGHGFFHGLKVNHPDLYKQVLNILEDTITNDQIAKYTDMMSDNPEYQKTFEGNRNAIIEEMLADEAGNTFVDKTFWEKIYQKSKELFNELISIIRDMFKKISGGQYSNFFTTRQADKFKERFEEIITEVRSRVKTGNIETKPVDAPVKFSMEKSKPSEVKKKEPVKPFFSKLQKSIEGKMPKAAFVQDIRGIINSAGIKPDEVKWSGIDTYLTSRIGSKVTKEELTDFLKMNELQIDEVTKTELSLNEKLAIRDKLDEYIEKYSQNRFHGGYDERINNARKDLEDKKDAEYMKLKESYEKAGKSTKYKNYQLTGGENYKELLFTLPQTEPKKISSSNSVQIEGIGNIEFADNPIDPLPLFRSQHWDESNVLAHTRFNDRTDADGNKILFIEEIQSDWHQAGRRGGYKTDSKWTAEKAEIQSDPHPGKREDEFEWLVYNEDRSIRLFEIAKTADEAVNSVLSLQKLQTPDAPFRKTWHEFVLKRLIRHAAENGYDKIAWTTGEQQTERYDLSKQVGSIQVYRNYKNGKSTDSYQFFVVDQTGHTLNDFTRGNASREQIAEMFGKDLGGRLADGADKSKGHRYEVSGDGLKIGGEGMKGFYDKIIPEYLNKYLKKWGSKVGSTEIITGNDGKLIEDGAGGVIRSGGKPIKNKQMSIDITPEMANSVMTEGQPLFSMRRKEVRKRINQDVDMEGILTKADKWKDRPVIAMTRETPERVIEAISKKDAPEIIKKFIDPIKKNEAAKIRWQKKEREEIADLGIKARSKESEFCQKYGEGEYAAVQKPENDGNYPPLDVPQNKIDYSYSVSDDKNPDITLKVTIVKYDLDDLMSDFPGDWPNIKKAAEVLKDKYGKYIDEINKVLTENGYDPIPKRKDYFMHFQEIGSILERFGVPVNINNLPTSINGLTDDFIPGKNFFAQSLPRIGKRTTYDAIQGIDIYMNGAGNIIYHTEDIQRLRAFQTAVRERYSTANVMEKAADLRQQLIDKDEYGARQKEVEDLMQLGDGHLSNFAAWLTEYTNQLAGKKARIDRALSEAIFGRTAYGVFDKLRKQVGANMVGANISSALTNFIPLTQSMATTQKVYFVKGMVSTMANVFRNDGFVDRSDYLTRRFGTDMLSMPTWDKIGNRAGFLFRWVDQFVSQTIVRGKYLELIAKGFNHEVALSKADDWAARLMADRSMGAMPNLFGSKALGIFTQFQLEVNNQLSFIFKDVKNKNYAGEASGVKKNIADKAPKFYNAAAAAAAIAQIFIYGYLFNIMFEKMNGRKPALDPIDIAQSSWKNYTNPKLTVQDANKKLIERVANQLPFASMLTGGRIPLGGAVPNPFDVATGESTWQKEIVKPINLLPPTGGGQIKKAVEGIAAMNKDLPGVYGGSSLKFPIEDNNLNRIRTAIFGKWSTPEATKYFSNNDRPLSEDQTKLLVDADLSSKETVSAYEAIMKYRNNNTEINKEHKEFKEDPAKLNINAETTYKAFSEVESTINKLKGAIDEIEKVSPDDESISELSKLILQQYGTANNLYDLLYKK